MWHRSLSRRLVGGLMAAAPLLPTAAFAAAPPLPAAWWPPGHGRPRCTRTDRRGHDGDTVVHTWAESKDCRWNIAERLLGDPARWVEI